MSVNFSQEVAVVNILVRCCEHLSGLTEAVKICCGADFTERASVAMSMYPVVGHGTSVSLFHDHIATMDGYMDGCTLTSKHYHHPSNPALISTP